LVLNDNTRPYVLNGVQILDIAPIPGPLGAILEVAAFAAAEYQILANDCLSSEQKIILSEANALNLGLGELAKVLPPAEFIAVPYEMTNWAGATFATNCDTASGSSPASIGPRKE
jgi:hypothetical protein